MPTYAATVSIGNKTHTEKKTMFSSQSTLLKKQEQQIAKCLTYAREYILPERLQYDNMLQELA